jgi:hypothetical protein
MPACRLMRASVEALDETWHPVGASTDIGPVPRACTVDDQSVQVWRTTTGEIVALAERPSSAFTRQQWPRTFLAQEFASTVYLQLAPAR